MPVYAGFTPAETRARAAGARMEPSYMGTFTGARRYVLHTFATTQSALMKKRVARYMVGSDCPRVRRQAAASARRCRSPSPASTSASCRGCRSTAGRVLRRRRRALRRAPVRAAALSRAAARATPRSRVAAGGSAHAAAPDVRRTPNLSEEKRIAAQRIAQDLLARIATLQELGLGYLSLDRSTPTLSPGELQRLRLATQIRSNLFGVVYVLDEPSAGLHPADTEALLRALDRLKAAGNSLFVVEHDLDVMRRADWIVDVGPDAGEHGGEVLYSGPPDGLARRRGVAHARATCSADAAAAHAHAARAARLAASCAGVTRNNLHDLDARFPLGVLTAVTGVSGSGKSSLVSQALVELVARTSATSRDQRRGRRRRRRSPAARTAYGGPHRRRRRARSGGWCASTRSRSAARRAPTSPPTPACSTTCASCSRRRTAARARRYDAGRFSFNVAKGRCETCEGEGFVSVELLFMPSVYAPCPTCHGARYNAKTLEIT